MPTACSPESVRVDVAILLPCAFSANSRLPAGVGYKSPHP
ncbi:hypothetical protein BSP109_00894 [Brevibacterium sp. Mu109]|nr:hypothetical protein BSP109_00894 [Brevibacterium sp. Mu109]